MLLTKGLIFSEDNVTNLEYVQKKIAIIFALLTFLLLIALSISDVFLGLSPVIIILKVSLAFPFLAAYFLVSKYGKTQIALNILLVLAHVVICINFLYNDGNDGPTIYVFFMMLVVSSLLIQGWLKLAWFLGSLSFFFLLFLAEVQGYVEVGHYYTGAQNKFIDHAVTVVWISVAVFAMLHFFIKSYQNLNLLLYSIKERQKQTLEDVKTLNDQKNKLIAILSHDLKAPIGMLHTTLGLVEKDAFEEGEMELILSNLKGQTFHLTKVLNNTLSWVMTELENSPVQLHQISLTSLTQELKDMMLVQAVAKNQTIEIAVKGEDLQISVEINEIRIILKNLLDNAIKFAPLNSTIHLRLEMDKNKISWCVCNSGVIISEADRKELFSFRARTSYGTQKEKGTGVGLPLCKKIADKIKYDLVYSSSHENHNCFSLIKVLS